MPVQSRADIISFSFLPKDKSEIKSIQSIRSSNTTDRIILLRNLFRSFEFHRFRNPFAKPDYHHRHLQLKRAHRHILNPCSRIWRDSSPRDPPVTSEKFNRHEIPQRVDPYHSANFILNFSRADVHRFPPPPPAFEAFTPEESRLSRIFHARRAIIILACHLFLRSAVARSYSRVSPAWLLNSVSVSRFHAAFCPPADCLASAPVIPEPGNAR